MIRPVESDDSAAVVALAVSSGLFATEDAGLVQTLMVDYFSGGTRDGHACLIDEENGRPLGVAYYQPAPATDRTWYLTMIAVHPERQGGGRGTVLLGRVEADLHARGQRLLLVETSGLPAFARTRAFYRRCGYDEEARVRDYYRRADDLIVFRKPLAS